MLYEDDTSILSKITQKNCTGCGTCKNICPVNAINIGEDNEGFLFPQVDYSLCVGCSACLKVCPVINTKHNKNSDHPVIYAVRASNEIREESSSGGVFSLFAEYILNNNGCVIGAGFDEKFHLHHEIAENFQELQPLRKSKYIQSDTGFIYRQTKDKLEQGKVVLFTGCPCQIAGLYRYLGKDYDRLYTVDIVCHGVPSQKIFDKYLDELSDGKVPISVDFRNKQHGWISNCIDVVFSDGRHYEGKINGSAPDTYELGFYRNLILRPSCSNCVFSEIPRVADLSMGDFWGIDKIDSSQNDGKGTSMLLINNSKGKELFNQIKEFCVYKELTINPSSLPNRFNRIYPENTNRQRFFDLIKSHPFKKSVEQALDGKHDIGLVGNYRAQNFGGALTYFALYQTLKDMGYSVLMIERPLDAKVLPVSINFLYNSSPYSRYDLAPLCHTKTEMSKYNNDCDIFLVGSDQLFQVTLYKELGRFVTLDWVSDNKIKIAYAASFGRDYVLGDSDTLYEMAYFIRKFDAFSVREESGVQIVKDNFGIQAEWVVDPVFLCDKKHYDDLTKTVHKDRNYQYIGAYILDPTEKKNDLIRSVADFFEMKTEVFSEMNFSDNPDYVKSLYSVDVKDYKVNERVECIMHCDFFVTDSFHGTCLAIIFKKPFVTILNEERGGERFRSLLAHLDLEERLVEDIDQCDIQYLITEPVNFDNAYKILEKDILFSRQWLQKALSSDIKKYSSDYDVLSKKIEAQEQEITQLNYRLHQLMGKINQGISAIEDIYDYLDFLIKERDKLVIIVSVKDTPGFALNENISLKLLSLGLKKDLKNNHWHSYIGILNGRRNLYERLSNGEEAVTFNGTIHGKKISVKSASLHQGNLASIVIDNKEYAVNKRGLNFVVLDKKIGEVMDSVCFDTHSKDLNCYRK